MDGQMDGQVRLKLKVGKLFHLQGSNFVDENRSGSTTSSRGYDSTNSRRAFGSNRFIPAPNFDLDTVMVQPTHQEGLIITLVQPM